MSTTWSKNLFWRVPYAQNTLKIRVLPGLPEMPSNL